MNGSDRITAIDLHACGEPGRVILGGVADVPGASMYEKMQHLRTHGDGLRKRMLREPRGYPAANCNLILPPTIAGADAGFIIMEQVEYPPMSGTNTICVATALAETGIVPVREGSNQMRLESPAGLIEVEVEMRAGKAVRVRFENVPAFAVHLDVPVEVRGLGTVRVDVAWGGMFYVIADAEALGIELEPGNARELVRIGETIKAATQEQHPVQHPENEEIIGPTIAELSAPARRRGVDRRNTVIVSTGKLDWQRPETWTGTLDRSPCGTGTCAKMAALHARGELALGRDFVHEGILGTTFTGRLLRETRVGPYTAVVPSISGRAWITGLAQYVLDASDPFPEGYTVGDLWGGN
ncbi:MAG: proline racemase family protein [Terriglobales bacterium]